MNDLLGGQVPVMFSDLVAALPHIKSGKLRALAVGSPNRVDIVPDVKTVAEQGFKGFRGRFHRRHDGAQGHARRGD